MMPAMPALLLVLIGLLPALPVPTAAAGFYFRAEEGWFWYERAPEPVVAPEPTPAPALPPAPLAEAAPAAEPEGLRPLSAQWLRERLGAYRDAAIDDPTPENVALYLYLQRVALDKSSRFAAATQRAVQLDPMLDEITQRPTATFAANLVNRESGTQRAAVLAELATRAGVLFFFRADCPYCEAQAPLLRLLAARYGFDILPVSLDGAPLPGGEFPAYRTDAGQAAALGVVSTPAMFLARPPTGLVPLAQGLLSLAQLEERLILAAAEAGWISPAEHARTRAVTAELRLDPQALPEPLPEDPERLLAALRALARSAAPTF
jgi:conjugal transfer pilus assembly protein TraF